MNLSNSRVLLSSSFFPWKLLVKGKIFSSLKHKYMRKYGGMEIKLHEFKVSVLDRDEWSASRPGRFTPWKEYLVPTRREAVTLRPQSRSAFSEEMFNTATV
jgi:hypothetical protein